MKTINGSPSGANKKTATFVGVLYIIGTVAGARECQVHCVNGK